MPSKDLSGDQCAVGPDGKLKDASDIDFFDDPDDDRPISGPSSSRKGKQSGSWQVTLHEIVKPATLSGGARRSERARLPSIHVRRANGDIAEVATIAPIATSKKRKLGRRASPQLSSSDEIPTSRHRKQAP
jgi:hypothetical protein